ncbi:mCG51212, partial [Mus musculus]
RPGCGPSPPTWTPRWRCCARRWSASDSWTCPCSANCTASTSPFRSTRERARQPPVWTAPMRWRMASSTMRRTSRSRALCRTGSTMALPGTSRPLPTSPAVTGFWSPSSASGGVCQHRLAASVSLLARKSFSLFMVDSLRAHGDMHHLFNLWVWSSLT